MSKNKFLLSVASISFAAITFTNMANSRADSAFIIGVGNAVSYGAGLTYTNNALAIGATGPNPSTGGTTTTTSTRAENGGFATGGTPGQFITGNGSADISNPSSAQAEVNTLNTQRAPNPLSRNGSFSDTFGAQQQTATPSNTPAPAAGFQYTTSF